MPEPDARKFAPATERNRVPILEVLQKVLPPPPGLVLEIASGTGEHAVFFAPPLAPLYWLPSDRDPAALDSIRAWQSHSPARHLLPPIALEVSQPHWSESVQTLLRQPEFNGVPLVAIATINMIHISPWSATLGLISGAEVLLPQDGILYLYGPYKQNGVHTAPSNESFNAMLRSQNPDWGVRDLEAVVEVAANHGLAYQGTIPMPANNLSVIFKRKT